MNAHIEYINGNVGNENFSDLEEFKKMLVIRHLGTEPIEKISIDGGELQLIDKFLNVRAG